MSSSQITALALFSGGLDSILACRVIADQGLRVLAVKFVTPFFDYEILDARSSYQAEMFRRYGFEVIVEDLSSGYLDLLHHPQHGFGRNFNPCIDCKILMLQRAKEMMAETGASFILTGEVLGQRPMSQRRDTLRIIERDSGVGQLLLRPLSAKLLAPSEAEARGWVDRDRLLDFNGRGRSRQIALAKNFGITDFPAPAGGCILADPILSRRIARIYQGHSFLTAQSLTVNTVRLLFIGRQFLLPGGNWLILGRDAAENAQLTAIAQAGDTMLLMTTRPGPTALLRSVGPRRLEAQDSAQTESSAPALSDDILLAASLVVRFGKKTVDYTVAVTVTVTQGEHRSEIMASPLLDGSFQTWALA